MEVHDWSFPNTRLTFQMKKVFGWVGGWWWWHVGLYVLSFPVPVPFLWTLNFRLWTWNWDLGLWLYNYLSILNTYIMTCLTLPLSASQGCGPRPVTGPDNQIMAHVRGHEASACWGGGRQSERTFLGPCICIYVYKYIYVYKCENMSISI